MIAALALLVAGANPTTPVDWAKLPQLPYRAAPQVSAPMNAFVQHEIAVGRCAAAAPARTDNQLQIDLAVLVDATGLVRTAVPRAIQCPTVEQYAAGLVTSFARNNLLETAAGAEQWYRTSLSFALRP